MPILNEKGTAKEKKENIDEILKPLKDPRILKVDLMIIIE